MLFSSIKAVVVTFNSLIMSLSYQLYEVVQDTLPSFGIYILPEIEITEFFCCHHIYTFLLVFVG